MKASITIIEQEKRVLTTNIDTLQQNYDQLVQKHTLAQTSIQEQNNKVRSLIEEQKNLKEQYSIASSERKLLEQQSQFQTEQIKRLQSGEIKSEQKIKGLQDTIDALRQEKNSSTIEISRLKMQLEQRSSIDSSVDLDRLQEEIQQLRKENLQLQNVSNNDSSKSLVISLQKKNNHLEEENKSQKEALFSLKMELQTSTEKIRIIEEQRTCR